MYLTFLRSHTVASLQDKIIEQGSFRIQWPILEFRFSEQYVHAHMQTNSCMIRNDIFWDMSNCGLPHAHYRLHCGKISL
jgi:hypothetical protein